MKELDTKAVENFRSYLRINTMQPNPDYASAIGFLRKYAGELGLDFKEVVVHPGKPLGIMTWKGSKPEMKSIVLSSHMDVVPVFPEYWKYDPFSAEMDAEGNIYARGSQDMKCVGIQYLEAIRRLMLAGFKPKRTVNLIFTPDEEIGSKLGMEKFIEHHEFKAFNAGVVLDEGLASPTNDCPVYYGERCVWWLKITVHGPPGHGSQLIENTVGERLNRILSRFFTRRDASKAQLQADPSLKLGDVLSINVTQLHGGVQTNVIPAEICVNIDVRVPPTFDLAETEKEFRSWCEAEGATLEFEQQVMITNISSTSPDNPWWAAFSSACESHKLKLLPQIFPAGTDARFARSIDLPAYGFSPMTRTPVLLHDHNEFLNRDVFLKGVEVYETIIMALSNVPEF